MTKQSFLHYYLTFTPRSMSFPNESFSSSPLSNLSNPLKWEN